MSNFVDLDPALQYVLLKGEIGLRKSTVALTYPLPQYWLSFDQKMESLMIPAKNFNIDTSKIEYDDYNDWMKAKMKLEKLQTNGAYLKGGTIIVDSITSMGDATNQQTLKFKGTAKAKGEDVSGKMIGGIAVNSIEDYNAEMAVFQELIALTKDIQKFYKVNIILIGHVMVTDYRSLDGKTHFSRQLVTGGKKAANKIPAYCTEVYHFNLETSLDASKGENYAFLTRHTGDDFARTALPLPDKVVFGNDNVYSKYILPAIEKVKNK